MMDELIETGDRKGVRVEVSFRKNYIRVKMVRRQGTANALFECEIHFDGMCVSYYAEQIENTAAKVLEGIPDIMHAPKKTS